MADFRLDRRGVGEILKRGQTASAVNALAGAIRDEVENDLDAILGDDLEGDEDGEVTMAAYTTDRGAAAVTIAHASGMAVQAKHGTLTRAAARHGLEVRSK